MNQHNFGEICIQFITIRVHKVEPFSTTQVEIG